MTTFTQYVCSCGRTLNPFGPPTFRCQCGILYLFTYSYDSTSNDVVDKG